MFDKTAPEFKDIRAWINSENLSLYQLRGKIVLLDFWTYSCVNCIRSLPHMKALNDRFSKNKFVIIGVHTPEFDFEKKVQNVEDAVERLGIKYPVAVDSDNTTWKLYGNRYWPRQVLIDDKGNIRYEHVGEGGYDDIEFQIENLLMEIGDKTMGARRRVPTEFSRPVTAETYLGSERSKGFGSSSVCVQGSCYRHIDSGNHKNNVVYLSGDWIQYGEYIKHAGEKGHVLLKYNAKVVNAVLAPSTKPFKIVVKINDRYVKGDEAGKNIKFEGGKSVVYIDRPDMYELVRTVSNQNNEIKLETESKDMLMYTFTFG